MKVKKGDHVVVLAGKDVGVRGTISRVIPETDRVIVDGVNLVKKHQRAKSALMQAGIIDKEMPIHVSNVALVCSSCGKPTRIGYSIADDGTKTRICRKCGKPT
jgi:large subunit ribosomal protein L24